jgi:lipoic acid synthetase
MGRLGRRIPDWIRFKIPSGSVSAGVRNAVSAGCLNTICVEARCPNIGECFNAGTATFLILGNVCTRNCGYCSVRKGTPGPADLSEIERLAGAVSALGLNYTVITSVTRDDLSDGGASFFTEAVGRIRTSGNGSKIEVLIPDFKKSFNHSIEAVIESRPDVINHNIEVVRPLFGSLRPMGDYAHSLKLIERVSSSGIPSKSGLMIGFGESIDDITNTMRDLREAGCGLLTVGQYLQPARDCHPVIKYYSPDEFKEIKQIADDVGFVSVQSGPLVRSSYHAGIMTEDAIKGSSLQASS